MKEIGSEFMSNSFKYGKNQYINLVDYPKRYVLSGRTGLYLIAQELKIEGEKSIALPAYCCSSMIFPFIESGFDIEFYSENSLPISKNVLIMDYFGFSSKDTLKFVQYCKKQNKIIIIDATQTAFSKFETYNYSDYLVVSYRKWLDCLCAAVYSKNGFKTEEYLKENIEYISKWRVASKMKKKYIEECIGEKKDYLDAFKDANRILVSDYKEYRASISEIQIFENLDSSDLRDCRRKNAQVLIQLLKKTGILMFKELHNEDCPLHVPIVLETEKRNVLRKNMIDSEIYCPYHWPIDKNFIYAETKLHYKEMSLICDQRYSVDDMNREASKVMQYIE
ncbi:hypothetical protein B5E87_02810 [Massilimicrobiota sp. An142]|uniref:hypothetical protein n=1 Tax=Massilimicrobiota sp. An142 TaxID=1965564 RepID=UPI000B3682B6|nr:hypothetical protein [Massilimicrobiota sp. An142]OUQ14430.1 hypothetical protein B5E87_02810 [Massilimicrobiota sp. An142]